MSQSIKERITANLQKAKSEQKVRLERIQGIVREAFSQTMAEVKEGSGELRAISKESLSTILEPMNERGEESNETANKPSSRNYKTLIIALFQTIKNQLLVNFRSENTNLQNQYAKLKNQAVNLDANLTERYGDRYVAVKQRLEKGATWYNAATAQAAATGTTVLEQKQAEVENKLSAAGATVAQKEQQVKQQLKALLQTVTAKV